MAIFDKILKKDAAKPSRKNEKEEAVSSKEPVAAASVKNQAAGAGILRAAHVTEKSVRGGETGKYTFKVATGTNKISVKKAVQDRYGVRVMSVNIIKLPSKTRRVGRHTGVRPGYTKAVVTLAKGESIEIS